MDKFRSNFGIPPGTTPMATGTPSGVPSAFDSGDGLVLQGFTLHNGCFVARTRFTQLRAVMHDPRLLVDETLKDQPALAGGVELNKEINRPFTSAKLRNVASYARYIRELVEGVRVGVLPSIVAYHNEALPLDHDSTVERICIPYDAIMGTLDGQTQLASHYEVWQRAEIPELRQRHGHYPLVIIIHHGIPLASAKQFFHDLNVLGVGVTTSLGLSMDSQDPMMKVVRQLEKDVLKLRGRIDYQSRQLPKRSSFLFTVQTMRQFVVNVARGLSGMQFGTKAVEISSAEENRVIELAAKFFTIFLDRFSSEVGDRDNLLLGAPAVMAAIGARLHESLRNEADWESFIAGLIKELEVVNWFKGEAWSGIAGKMRIASRGRRAGEPAFAIGGPKETAYSIYAALFDQHDPGFAALRAIPHQRTNAVA